MLDPVAEAPPTDPVPEFAFVALVVDGVAAGLPADPDVAALSVTTPLSVTPPGVAEVCASAGRAAATEISNAQQIRGVISLYENQEITALVNLLHHRPIARGWFGRVGWTRRR